MADNEHMVMDKESSVEKVKWIIVIKSEVHQFYKSGGIFGSWTQKVSSSSAVKRRCP